MLGMNGVINPVQMNHLQIFIRQKYKRGISLFFELFGRGAVLRIDDPNRCSRFKFLRVFDQLPELVITPRSPFATHENQHYGIARS